MRIMNTLVFMPPFTQSVLRYLLHQAWPPPVRQNSESSEDAFASLATCGWHILDPVKPGLTMQEAVFCRERSWLCPHRTDGTVGLVQSPSPRRQWERKQEGQRAGVWACREGCGPSTPLPTGRTGGNGFQRICTCSQVGCWQQGPFWWVAAHATLAIMYFEWYLCLCPRLLQVRPRTTHRAWRCL